MMYVLEYLIYHLKPYGIVTSIHHEHARGTKEGKSTADVEQQQQSKITVQLSNNAQVKTADNVIEDIDQKLNTV